MQFFIGRRALLLVVCIEVSRVIGVIGEGEIKNGELIAARDDYLAAQLLLPWNETYGWIFFLNAPRTR